MTNRCPTVVNRALGAVSRDQERVVGETRHNAVAEDAPNRILGRFPGGLIDNAKDVFDGVTACVL
jgi:hypothetical protein